MVEMRTTSVSSLIILLQHFEPDTDKNFLQTATVYHKSGKCDEWMW